jgi:hypothetical protein
MEIQTIISMKKIFLIILISATICHANDVNSIFIEQIGNDNNITLTQSGISNNIGLDLDNYSTINGNSNLILIEQTGDNNSHIYNIIGNNNNFSSVIQGGTNLISLTVGGPNGNLIGNSIEQSITGNGNVLSENITSNNITSKTTIVGDLNDINLNLLSENASLEINIEGSDNKLDNIQDLSAGINGHNLKIDILGSLNQINTLQSSTVDSVMHISIDGSNNIINITSTN